MLFIIAIILFICNFLNVILYGIEEATKKTRILHHGINRTYLAFCIHIYNKQGR